MGYALAFSPCFGCKRVFGYNPLRVPSAIVNGAREPICRDCIERINQLCVRNGLDPIVPFADAYEPIEESKL